MEVLSCEEFVLLELYIDITDYGDKNYGTFLPKSGEIVSLLKCSRRSYYYWHKKLMDLGLVQKTENGRFEVLDIDKSLPYKRPPRRSSSATHCTDQCNPLHKSVQPIALTSSGKHFNSFNEGFNDTTINEDDREWIDYNVREDPSSFR